MSNFDNKNEYFKISDAYNKESDISKIKDYKSPYLVNDKNILKGLDNISNKINLYKNNTSGFLNLSLLEIFKNTSTTMLEIIHEISLILEIDKNNYEKWWEIYLYKLREIYVIITKKDRLIYLGLILIFLSLVVYFIEISS